MNRSDHIKTPARWGLLLALLVTTSGCGNFMARQMARAPNRFPEWLAPRARVELAFEQKFLTNFPTHFAEVGPPTARLRYRVIQPADYDFSVTASNWMKRGKPYFHFAFHATVPGATNAWSARPRGTVLLLHGYGVEQFTMTPWALRLGQDGWRCVLVDLRGHGKSTGERIYYGMQEPLDLSQLLDRLANDGQLSGPIAAIGESFGATLALRLKASDARVKSVVAIAPYATLSSAVLNICREYANWMPKSCPRAGLKKLPERLKVPPAELDPITMLARHPVAALFVAGGEDRISPVSEVMKLYTTASPGSELVVVPQASHESVAYHFDDLVAPVLGWLDGEGGKAEPIPDSRRPAGVRN